MSNSKLYGKFLPIKSPFILKHLTDLIIKYKDKAELSNYVISEVDKPKDSISYSYAKKLKNYFDNRPDRNSEEYLLKGGNEFKNYINKLLSSERHMIYRNKRVKSNIGMENQFIKTHSKDSIKPTSLDNLKPKNSMEDISLTENINNTKEACVCVIIGDDKKLLLGQRSSNDDWQPGKYAIFGGTKEQGESSEDCVIREVKEESNLNLVNPIFCFSKQEGKTLVKFFVGFITNPNEIKVSSEHNTYKWVDTNELKQLDCVPDLIKDISKCLTIFAENTYLK